jgi:hypothetical protein
MNPIHSRYLLFQPRSFGENRSSRSMEHLDRPADDRPDRSLAAATAANAAAAAASAAAAARRRGQDAAIASVGLVACSTSGLVHTRGFSEEERRRRAEHRRSTPTGVGAGIAASSASPPPTRGAAATRRTIDAGDVHAAAEGLAALSGAGAGSVSRSQAILRNTINPLLAEVLKCLHGSWF